MLIPIENFPYGKQNKSNTMYKKLLLLELKGFGRPFTIGYYDAVQDVFCTWSYPGFIQTKDSKYEEMQIEDTGLYCILPRQFIHQRGGRTLKGYMPLKNALIRMFERKMRIEDIENYLDGEHFCGYCVPHLLCLKNGHILVSETSCFCDDGNQFSAFSPSEINGNIYHSSGQVPREDIHYAVNLTELGYAVRPHRMTDADMLFNEIKKNDLSYMQQSDIMACIKDVIERNFGNAD